MCFLLTRMLQTSHPSPCFFFQGAIQLGLDSSCLCVGFSHLSSAKQDYNCTQSDCTDLTLKFAAGYGCRKLMGRQIRLLIFLRAIWKETFSDHLLHTANCTLCGVSWPREVTVTFVLTSAGSKLTLGIFFVDGTGRQGCQDLNFPRVLLVENSIPHCGHFLGYMQIFVLVCIICPTFSFSH